MLRICSSAVLPTSLDHTPIAFLPYIILIFIFIARTRRRNLYKRSLAIDEKIYGCDHPEFATDLNN